MILLLSGFQGSAAPRDPDGFMGKYVWSMPDKDFGGFSGIEVLDDGRNFVALTDKAMFVTGRFQRDAMGHVIGVKAGAIRPLIGAKSGKHLSDRRADSEGLAIAADGSAFVSFENRTRVARLQLDTGVVRDIDGHRDFHDLPRNGSLEALAIAEDGTLFAVPEDPPGPDLPVYVWRDEGWQEKLFLPKRGNFAPVAADIGPDGRFYLLERDFQGIGGFSNRLRRFDLTESGFAGETTLIVTPSARYDNLEGLSIWRDVAGGLRATMISDDNFFFLQQTQIVEFALPD